MLEILESAIKARKPISFIYSKEGKTAGTRIGNPHAVFITKRKDGTQSTKVHVVQTAGASDSGQQFPSFRMFDLSALSQISVLENEPVFPISDEYNPLWEGYAFVIAKI